MAKAVPATSFPDQVTLDGHVLKLSNLDKVLYPETGFTKGQVIDYYLKIAPVMLPHIKDKPMTLHRFPNGVEGQSFYEKNRPTHAPEWIKSADIQFSRKVVNEILAQDRATMVWMANLASLEMHPLLCKYKFIDRPTKMTFDLDPGAPATIIECCQVALHLRDLFGELGLKCFPKTSGSKGMQVEVPLNTTAVTFKDTKSFAHAVARLLESREKALVVSDMKKELRKGKILIDWSQNDAAKTTVAPYSLRARARNWVSTPITWDEVEDGANAKGEDVLRFETDDTLARVEKFGDLYADVLKLKQKLPELN